jgi:guanine deaminase
MTVVETSAFRAGILHFFDDPVQAGDQKSYTYYPDGLLLIRSGKIEKVGPAEELLHQLPPETKITTYPHSLIVPGFIDCHVHYPQIDMIAAPGGTLLEWLEQYVYPIERQFANSQKAAASAEIFLDELLRNGTTTAMVFATVHPTSVEAFFSAAQKRRLRMICGKVLMDRNAPHDLTDTPESAYTDSKALIVRWHGKERLSYAVTPRFAPTSSDAQLALAGRLLNEHPDLYLQTHLAENHREIEWVDELFPHRKNYLDVYHHHGLLGRRTVLAHCIHLETADFQLLRQKTAGIAFCPTSNLFLGSGLFDYKCARANGVNVSVGSDVGAGTSFSMLRCLNEAYKIQKLQDFDLPPLNMFYLATLGGARTLALDHKIGNFEPGKEADFVVLDFKATPLLTMRIDLCHTLAEKLFLLAMLGDDRAIAATYIMGQPAYRRDRLSL